MALTDRAGRWVTEQVGRWGRTVDEVAVELGCDWHTVNDAVIAYGTALVDDDPDRIGEPAAVGLDETLFARRGPVAHPGVVDLDRRRRAPVSCSMLIDGRDSRRAVRLVRRPARGWWRAGSRWATLDLSGPVSGGVRHDAARRHPGRRPVPPGQAGQPASSTRCRRRVQNETLGHRGRKTDPLYRCRRLLTKADERLDDDGRTRLLGLLEAGDPQGEVRTAWHAKEVVRSIYDHTDPDLAARVRRPARPRPPRRRLPARGPPARPHHRALADPDRRLAPGPRVQRADRSGQQPDQARQAGGVRVHAGSRNYRIRALLYAGRPNWDLLPTITPR